MRTYGLRALAAAIVIAVATSACAGGGNSLPSATLGSAALPGAAATSAKRTKGTATIRITVPKRKRHLRRSKYVSPATQSIAIAIAPSSGGRVTNYYVNLTPATNPHCTASLISPLVCTVTLSLAKGKYTASFTTYDGLSVGGNPPSGNVLSSNQYVPVTIAAGKSNAIDVVLDGVPTAVALVPSAGSGISGSMDTGFAASKCGVLSAAVTVLGIDADNNYILGPGAPVPSLSAPAGSSVAVATPVPSSPNRFKITTKGIPQSSITLTAAVTPPAASGGSAQTAHVPLAFVGSGSCIVGNVTTYPLPNTASSALSPYAIAAGSDGALWFTEAGISSPTGGIGRITTDGVITNYTIPTSTGVPVGIAKGPDNAMWFTEWSGNNVGRIATDGTVTEYPIPTSGSQPYGIVTGPDNALWFTECSGNKIGRITTTGTFTEYTIGTSGAYPNTIAVGPDNALWFTEYQGNKIGRITTDGTITNEYSIPTTGSGPWGITAGPDGALWFAETVDKIGRITTSGTIQEYTVTDGPTGTAGITTGPDGALWFAAQSDDFLGRITTTGAMSAYELQGVVPNPGSVTLGPDNNLWFTACSGNAIGVIK